MKAQKKIAEIRPEEISHLLINHFSSVMSGFFEMQSSFLSGIYKKYKNIETASIVLCLAKNTHLEILRKREKNLNHDVSLENFWKNFSDINRPGHKVVSIVKMTGIPKETVRRKIKYLIAQDDVENIDKHREYSWKLNQKNKDKYFTIIFEEINFLSKFVSKCASLLNIELKKKDIEDEVKSQFCFYWYHFLNYQVKWLKMWQDKIKDIDLVLITLQAVIPTLQYLDKNQNMKDLGLDKIHTIIGKTNDLYKTSDTSISAASVSEVTGIPRATCIRKLEMLVKLGMLIRETKTKRYYVSQITSGRTKNILTKENVLFSIENFSEYLSIIINSLVLHREK